GQGLCLTREGGVLPPPRTSAPWDRFWVVTAFGLCVGAAYMPPAKNGTGVSASDIRKQRFCKNCEAPQNRCKAVDARQRVAALLCGTQDPITQQMPLCRQILRLCFLREPRVNRRYRMSASKVYFTDLRTSFNENLPQKLERLIKTAGIGQIDFQNKFTAIKIHFGE